ncbi:LPS assembly lipoprotein LptE [Acerihabitans sp. TG2]|uniref:LPS assembly lipoprotein LptE n=1 Tax=Acerihabitans sp. TG2 TaxID=3096008 RepID=UPI002B22DEA2|nr:LPS assembly lipoprotein LptE [Acerihabitans sp. TG2]MEA9392265.1 LPS assembly lipoprotein LptE [Acerihabitans sp. TG2]
MHHRTIALLLGFAVLVTAGCGYHLRGTTSVPKELKTLTLNSYDPYGPLTRSVREQLRLSDVTVVKDKDPRSKKLPSLRITGSSEGRQTISIFRDGKTAEYQLVLEVNAQVLIPGKDLFPITIRVFRSFFDNPLTALAKDNEGDIIRQELREQAAQQLVRKLVAVQTAEEDSSAVDAKLGIKPAVQEIQ